MPLAGLRQTASEIFYAVAPRDALLDAAAAGIDGAQHGEDLLIGRIACAQLLFRPFEQMAALLQEKGLSLDDFVDVPQLPKQ